MNKKLFVALALVGASAGCKDFLSGPGLTINPNSAVIATAQQQLIAVQASAWTRLEGQIARNASIYTQQLIGSNNQQLTYATQYGITESDIGGQMTGFYTGAGLVGLRKIQEAADEVGDPTLEGIALIWEGFSMGMAASVWGDLPYSEAVDDAITTPKLDTQAEVYTQALAAIDAGIAALGGTPTGNCEPSDLVYCASVVTRAQQHTRWIAAANTIKARFHLHLAERNGNAAYTAALAAANAGILEAPTSATQAMDGQGPGDFRSFHGTTLDQDGNIWAEFLTSRQDFVAGDVMVNLLETRADPRLTRYFNANSNGSYVGHDRNNAVVLRAGDAGSASTLNTPVRRALNFRQPIVTWAENQLILAEAKFKLTGAAAAEPHVNAVRAAVGLAALPVASINLEAIMLEKYIVQFQNVDVWNDYKRTCYPKEITPYATATEVPGRLPYASAERSANPNLPLPNAYPAGTSASIITTSKVRNWNDPNACTAGVGGT
jgi:hypothetical protein